MNPSLLVSLGITQHAPSYRAIPSNSRNLLNRVVLSKASAGAALLGSANIHSVKCFTKEHGDPNPVKMEESHAYYGGGFQ